MIIGTTSPYFQNYTTKTEQDLLESLVVESISIYGIDCYYIPRQYNNYDQLYGTDTQSTYTNFWQIAIYMNTPLGFTGDREFMSKFAGLEIRDQLRFSIPRYTFDQVIAGDSLFPPLPLNESQEFGSNRPREGDLIFFPFNRKLFQIKFVNKTEMFWQLGKLYTWEVTTELFEYSNETIQTGIPDIDRIMKVGNFDMLQFQLTDLNGTPILLDPYSDYWLVDQYAKQNIQITEDNAEIEKEANTLISWEAGDLDPFASANTQGPLFSPTI